MDVFTVRINDSEIAISSHNAALFPGQLEFDLPDVERSTICSLQELLTTGYPLGSRSFCKLYHLARLFQLLGIPTAELAARSPPPTDMVSMYAGEYAPLYAHLLGDSGGVFDRFIRRYPGALLECANCLALAETKADIDFHLKFARTVYEIDIAGVYGPLLSQAATRDLARSFEERVGALFFELGAVHDVARRNGPLAGVKVWPCEKLSPNVPRPALGELVFTDPKTARERYSAFTFGLLDKSPNPHHAHAALPWENMVIAGGSVAKIVAREMYEPALFVADVDIFITGAEFDARQAAFKRVIDWFRGPDTYFSMCGAVVAVYLVGIKRKFQIIPTDRKSGYDVIYHFDMSHIQWGYQNGTFICSPSAVFAAAEGVTRILNISNPRFPRLAKALLAGFSIAKHPVAKSITNMNALAAGTSLDYASFMKSRACWYYPMPDPDLCPEMLREHHRQMIERDDNSHIVRTDPSDIEMEEISTGLNTYGIISYSAFDAARVRRVTIQPNSDAVLQTAIGVLKMESPPLHVIKDLDDETLTYVVQVPIPSLLSNILEALDKIARDTFADQPELEFVPIVGPKGAASITLVPPQFDGRLHEDTVREECLTRLANTVCTRKGGRPAARTLLKRGVTVKMYFSVCILRRGNTVCARLVPSKTTIM